MDYSNQGTVENICENASKLSTFIDLAGHQKLKYLRTTIHHLRADRLLPALRHARGVRHRRGRGDDAR